MFIILLIIGLYFTAGNWYIVINYRLNKKTSSSIPFIGGLLLCVSLWNLLPDNLRWLSFFGLIIDRCCLPLLILTLYCIITGKYK
jgi:hypothetical protein